jgi:hypothetical protein
MGDWYKFILKIKPDGKAFRSILFSKIFHEVLAYAFNLVKEYAVLTINDQVWFVNDNFDPEPWEKRYEINVPELSSIEERRLVVKGYMLFPQSQNRLSRDYIQSSIDDSGFENILIEYNSSGDPDGFLRANDISDEKLTFAMGPLSYNSFRVSGNVSISYYYNAIYLIMSLKPLQVALYDTMTIYNAFAIDNSNVYSINGNVYALQ